MVVALFTAGTVSAQVRDTVPEPRQVMLKSVMVPGWGQVVNDHSWKVPVVYATLAAIAGYNLYAHSRYTGFRAAYYNSIPANTDNRFGATPDWVPDGQPAAVYKANRDLFRNRRDMSYVYFGLAWGFNALDAYIFAHLKDFDVSDDLSVRMRVRMLPVPGSPVLQPGLNLTIPLP